MFRDAVFVKNIEIVEKEPLSASVPAIRQILVDRPTLERETPLGRELLGELLKKLPHMVVGTVGLGPKRMARREDVDRFFAKATFENLDIVRFIRDTPTPAFREWFAQ
jgi:hypothetical protein